MGSGGGVPAITTQPTGNTNQGFTNNNANSLNESDNIK